MEPVASEEERQEAIRDNRSRGLRFMRWFFIAVLGLLFLMFAIAYTQPGGVLQLSSNAKFTAPEAKGWFYDRYGQMGNAIGSGVIGLLLVVGGTWRARHHWGYVRRNKRVLRKPRAK